MKIEPFGRKKEEPGFERNPDVKMPDIKIIGNAPPEIIEIVKKNWEAAISGQPSIPDSWRRIFSRYEIKKGPREKAVIEAANAITNELREKFGLQPYNIPTENVHFLQERGYQEIVKAQVGNEENAAISRFRLQTVILSPERHPDRLALVESILHEFLHLKVEGVLEIRAIPPEEQGETEKEEGVEIIIAPYRQGISVGPSPSGKYPHQHFEGLHEAIVSWQTQRSFPRLLELAGMEEYLPKLNSPETQELKRKILEGPLRKKAKRGMVREEDIMWVEERGGEVVFYLFPYLPQVNLLRYVCEQIQQEFPQQYSTPEEVFEEFLKAHFTGRLLTIARLVETTFGRGSFRTLADMSEDENSLMITWEKLERSRARVKK